MSIEKSVLEKLVKLPVEKQKEVLRRKPGKENWAIASAPPEV